MAVFIDRERWRRQPSRPVGIDKSHPLAPSLRFFIVFIGGVAIDLQSWTIGTRNGSAALQASPVPVGAGSVAKLASASSDYYEFAHRPEWEMLGELTLAWRGQINSGGNYRHFAGKHTAGGSANTPFDFRTDNGATPKASLVRAAGTSRAFDSISTIPLSVVATVEVSQGADIGASPSFYIQGAPAGSTAPTFSGNATGAAAPLRIGRRPDGAVQMDGVTEYVAGFASVLSADALREFRLAPYALLAQRETRVTYSLGGAPTLTIADATHGHAVDPVTLTQVHQLAAADAMHAQTVDALNLSQVHALVAQDATHGHQTDALTLTQAHLIAVADALHAHAVDHLNLSGVATLAISDALHAHSTDNATLGAGSTLAIADALHAHAADAVALGQVHVMVVADAIHAQLVSAVALSLPGAVLAGERCLVIPTETRALVVLAESRALAIAAEIRVLTIH